MSKDKSLKSDKIDHEVVTNIKNVYYCAIVAPDDMVRRMFKAKCEDTEFQQKALIHSALWRSTGSNATGSTGFLTFSRIMDDDSVYQHVCNLHGEIGASVNELMNKMDHDERKQFHAKNAPIVDIYLNKINGLKSFGFNNVINGIFGINSDLSKNYLNIYNLGAECVQFCLDETVLGVGEAPIYVPVITKKITRTITFIALFRMNPLYEIFEKHMNSITANPHYGDVKEKKSVVVKLEQMTKELFDRLKKTPDPGASKA